MGVELRPRAFLRHWPKLSGGLLRRQPEANPCLTRIQAQDLEADGFEPFATHQDQWASPRLTPIYGKTSVEFKL